MGKEQNKDAKYGRYVAIRHNIDENAPIDVSDSEAFVTLKGFVDKNDAACW